MIHELELERRVKILETQHNDSVRREIEYNKDLIESARNGDYYKVKHLITVTRTEQQIRKHLLFTICEIMKP